MCRAGTLTLRLEAIPGTAVLILSMYSETSYVRIALDAGARGYLLKSAMDLELGEAVRRVAAGKQVLDSRIILPTRPSDVTVRPLTTRELEVLQLIAEGKSNKEIGKLLGITARTVAVHRFHIMGALEVHNTATLNTTWSRQESERV